jgi:hypothetical protein
MNLKSSLHPQTTRILQWSAFGLSASVLLSSFIGYANQAIAQSNSSGDRPTSGTVRNLVSGDIMCYVTLVDRNGRVHENIGATFDICANSASFLNQPVTITYGQESVSDCQSAEPCGRSRLATLITQMQLVNRPSNCFQGASAGYLPARLQVNQRGHSIHVGNLNLRQRPGLQGRIVGTLPPGGRFTVLDGPFCSDNYVWWKVNTGRTQGWVAEGEPSSFVYWLTPDNIRN